MMSGKIRKIFIEYFESKNHTFIESASLVPIDDDSLLFNNAGVTPIKKFFDGSEVPKNKRMVNYQKCLRTIDIESVGDTYHHTFFEMLGNFSIGDYFKKEAIEFSYDLLVNHYKFDVNKLYFSYYPSDIETKEYWLKLGIKEDHLIPTEGNFWEIGEGPCGPSTEIFFDRGEEFDSLNLGTVLIKDEMHNERFIEIWNNVFSQYNSIEGLDRKDYPKLPNKNIDTGMGFERIVAILQNKNSNYDTDLFQPIIKEIEKISNIKYSEQKEFRIIADHIRTLVMGLNDNVYFSNEKRGYVIRRILRRASVFAKQININEPFLYKLVDSVINILKKFYPDLLKNSEKIKDLILKEEQLFAKTLNNGEKKLKEFVSKKDITSKDVFLLYDTYGFPFELTQEYLKEYNIEVSKEEFDELFEKHKEVSRSESVHKMNMQNEELLNFKESSEFLYNTYITSSKIIKIIDNMIILDKTPFYAESGGQVSDTGTINDYKVLEVIKAPNKQHLHIMESNDLKEGDVVEARIDEKRRLSISKHHSSTHLLQKVLKEVLDPNICQAGSKVSENEFRFDFNYNKSISDDEILLIEKKLNEKIVDSKVSIELKNIEEVKNSDIVMLFNEKYEDVVRVVQLSDSIELCGGTHVEDLSIISKIAIKSIENKGNNLYRITGVCDEYIVQQLFSEIKPYNDEMVKLLEKAQRIIEEAKFLNFDLSFNIKIDNEKPKSYKDVVFNREELKTVKDKVKDLEKEFNFKKQEKILLNLDVFDNQIKIFDDFEYMILKLENYDNKLLKSIVDKLTEKLKNGTVFIANITENNVNFISKTKNPNINVGLLVKEISVKCLGSGGGSSSFAQGGGTSIDKLDGYLSEIDNIIKNVKI